jgi:hypothetical protein
MRKWNGILSAASIALVAFVGCGGDGETAPPDGEPSAAPAPADASARTLSIPGVDDGAGAPPGPGHAAAPGLHWDLPAGWVAETPASNMRLARYRVGDDGECIVFYFGPGQGGDPASNARRWGSQFKQADGVTSEDLVEVTWLEDSTVPVMLVEVGGTYDGGMTMTAEPARPQPGYRLLGGIAEGADAPWFFKFVGPEATVQAEREAFVGMMRSIRRGG